MYKPNKKKMLTAIVAITMVFSAFAVLSLVAQPAFAASGTITANYTTLYTSTNNFVLINGGTFASGSPLWYEFSQTNSWSGSGSDWFSLTAGSTTLSNGGIVLDPTSTGTWYLLVADSVDATSGVISVSFSAVSQPAGVPVFQVDPASGTLTSSLPGSTSSAAKTATVYGQDIPASDSVTVTMVTGWTQSSPYTVPTGSQSTTAAKQNTQVASATYTGAQLDSSTGVTFTMPVVSGGDYGFIAVDTTAGTPVLSSNFESATDYSTIATSGWHTTSASAASFTPAYLTFATSTPTTLSSLQLFTVKPSIVYSVASLSGSASEVFSFTGYGFIASDTFTSGGATQVVTIGGINVVYSGTLTVQSNGEVSFTSVHLSGAINTYGSKTVAMTDDQGTSYSSLNAIYVSTPSINKGTFTITDLSTGSSSPAYVGDTFEAIVYEYPAGTSVTFTMNNESIGTATTDSNGYVLLTGSVPALPGSSTGRQYTLYAMANTGQTGVSGSATLTLFSYATGTDSANYPIFNVTASTYVPSGSALSIADYGVNPLNTYVLSGSLSSSVTVLVGAKVATKEFSSAANGTLILDIYAHYSATASTGTSETITFTAENSAGSTVYTTSVSIDAVGAVSDNGFPDTATAIPSGQSVAVGGSVSVPTTITGLISDAATLFYPTVTNDYSMYYAPALTPSSATLITFANGKNYFTSVSSGLTFTAPSSTGVYNVYIDYYGTSASSAYANMLDSYVFVVSNPSGTPQIFMSPTDNTIVSGVSTPYFIAFNLPASASSETLVINGNGKQFATVSGTDTNGILTISEYSSTITTLPAGTYQAYVVTSNSGPQTTAVASLTFTVTAGTDTALSTSGFTLFQSVGTLDFYGLAADTLYNVDFNGTLLAQEYSGSDGAFTYSVSSLSSYGIYVAAGDYNFTVAPASDPTAIVSAATIPVTVNQNPELTVSTAAQYAFPGQVVQFSVNGISYPSVGVGNVSVEYPQSYEANIYFNNTLFATVPATFQTQSGTTYLNGSFNMPNNAVGTYYVLKITGLAVVSNFLGGSILSSTELSTSTLPMVGSQSDFFGLAEGNGALLTGITASEIATLEVQINSTVSKSLTIPIAQLDAAITSINGAVATLKTTVGNISTDLSTINATVVSISAGVVKLDTLLGSVTTSLASIDATLVSFNGTLVTLNTAIGTQTATLNAINGSVTSTATSVSGLVGSVATISTDVGTISGTITSVQGSVATIQTAVGNLNTSVASIQTSAGQIKTSQGTNEIFEIVIVVLVLITLVAAFIAITSVGRVVKKLEEQKKP